MGRRFLWVIGAALIAGLGVCLMGQGPLHAEERVVDLKTRLATAKNAGNAFESAMPPFRLSIPGTSTGHWYFATFDDDNVPFYIVKPETVEHNLPFISSMVELVPREYVARPEELFRGIAAEHEAFERKVIPGFKMRQSGRAFTVNGLPAYERAFEHPADETVVHMVYILYGNALIQLGLNTNRPSFEQDHRDFMGIVASFQRMPAASSP